MHKIKLITVASSLLLAACTGSSLMPSQKYIDAISALGCKGLQEGNPAADEVLKQHGVTPEQIQKFRQKSDFKTMEAAVSEIVKRVSACAGVRQ